MIYKINNKYYVKIGYEYNEIELSLDKSGDVILRPLPNRIESPKDNIVPINFMAEKENLKKELFESKNIVKEQSREQIKPRKSQWR